MWDLSLALSAVATANHITSLPQGHMTTVVFPSQENIHVRHDK